MKYTQEIIISKPIKEVVALFDNPNNLYEWMEGLQKFEHLSGTPGEPGAKSKLLFKMGNREIEMIETITARDLPTEFSGTYEANGVFNIQKNKFISIAANQTKHVTENEFQFKGVMMNLMGFLMPGAFKKQSYKYLKAFKTFAEK